MTRVRRRSSQYATIPNHAMRNENLSIEARGLLAMMMTYSDDWTFRTSAMSKAAKVGRDKLQRMVRELKDAGYIEIRAKQGEDGKLVGQEWEIHDEPVCLKTRQAVDTVCLKTRPTVNPPDGKSGPLRKTNSKNNQLEETPCLTSALTGPSSGI